MIINNDCLMALKELPENSVDAIITDPPYGLSFMGKKWDYDVPSVEIWAECLRVLKPGGYLLAFAGTRTQHRMAVRIEDAGFEIRDMIAWIYGSGFPKSLNIGKAVDKMEGTQYPKNTLVSENGSMSGGNYTRNTIDIQSELGKEWEGWGTATKPAVEPVTIGAKPLLLSHIFAILSLDITNKLWQKLNANVSDVEQTLKSIQLLLEKAGVNSVHENARMLSWENIESVAIAAASSTLPKPTLNEQTEGNKELFVITNVNQTGNDNLQENQTQIGKEGSLSEQMDMLLSILVTSNIDLNTILLWKNILEDVLQRANTFTISTALKMITGWKTCNFLLSANIQNFTSNNVKISPNCEPICMARKPLAEKTVAENVLKYGTGGINIDGCRVATTDKPRIGNTDKSESIGYGADSWQKSGTTPDTGRFPANLIHDGSDEVLGLFPETKTNGVKTPFVGDPSSKINIGGGNVKPYETNSGSAARFFKTCQFTEEETAQRFAYIPKASKSERNRGCEGLEEKEWDFNTMGTQTDDAIRARGRNPENQNKLMKNNHPTVKPIALMEYLVKLVSKEGHTVLDPFLGSGTTAIACKNLNRNCIGIERDAEYVKISEARISAVK